MDSEYLWSPKNIYLVFWSSSQCVAVDLCICFYQLLDEGSMMTIKVVINLITGKGQFRVENCLLHFRLHINVPCMMNRKEPSVFVTLLPRAF
ncbi:hypothetical protein STEG23_000600 [Scotinomys teguina]